MGEISVPGHLQQPLDCAHASIWSQARVLALLGVLPSLAGGDCHDRVMEAWKGSSFYGLYWRGLLRC